MSKKMQTILSSYHILQYTTNEELIRVRLDIVRALNEAPLSSEERRALQRRYFTIPSPPEARAGSVGRPKSGETQKEMAIEVLGSESKSIKFTRLLQSACNKLALYLGEDYLDEPETIEMGSA